MNKRLPTTMLILCLTLAVILTAFGLFFIFTKDSYVKCNRFNLNAITELQSITIYLKKCI